MSRKKLLQEKANRYYLGCVNVEPVFGRPISVTLAYEAGYRAAMRDLRKTLNAVPVQAAEGYALQTVMDFLKPLR